MFRPVNGYKLSILERLFVTRLRARDERAFKEMVEQYQNRIYNMAYRMLGTKDEAEDAAQEVFITVFKSIDQFRGDSKLSTWLYRVTANHCKNRIKYLACRHQRDTSSLDDAAERRAVAQGGGVGLQHAASVDRVLEGREVARMVNDAIRELDEDHRLVVVLRDLEDLSYEEICAVTGLPEGTVKSRLHRARLALKEKLVKTRAGGRDGGS